MKRLSFNKTALSLTSLYIITVLFVAHTAVSEFAWNPDDVQNGKGHQFACADYSGKKVFIVSESGDIEWEYKTGNANDLWVLPNGNLLFNTGKGVQEVNRKGETVFSFESKGEVYACQRLENGNTFIGECSLGRLIDVDPSGKIVKEVRLLPEGTDGGHAYMRNARKLPNGNYLVAHYGSNVVKEYNTNGQVVMEIPAPGGPHSVCRLPNGNTIIASGDKSPTGKIVEVDKDGKTIWQLDESDLPGISLYFMTGFHRLPNGNTVISNWLGHGKFGKAPHIIEVTPDKKVVWTFQNKALKTASSVQILDVKGNPIKGEIYH